MNATNILANLVYFVVYLDMFCYNDGNSYFVKQGGRQRTYKGLDVICLHGI